MSDTYGLTVLADDCAFSVEITRSAIRPSVMIIDEEFDERGVPNTDEDRVELAVMDALDLADSMMEGVIDREIAINEIAINFVYAFMRQTQRTDLDGLRGMLACVKGDAFVVHPCETDALYEEASDAFRQVTKVYMGGEDEDDLPPTIH